MVLERVRSVARASARPLMGGRSGAGSGSRRSHGPGATDRPHGSACGAACFGGAAEWKRHRRRASLAHRRATEQGMRSTTILHHPIDGERTVRWHSPPSPFSRSQICLPQPSLTYHFRVSSPCGLPLNPPSVSQLSPDQYRHNSSPIRLTPAKLPIRIVLRYPASSATTDVHRPIEVAVTLLDDDHVIGSVETVLAK